LNVPSRKPFVIAYISEATDGALRSDAAMLTELKLMLRAAGYVPWRYGQPEGAVQAGQVAVEQLRRVLKSRASLLRKPLPPEPRPIRQRWLVEPELHSAIHARATSLNLSVSELVARMVQPPEARAQQQPLNANDPSLRFHLPSWASKMLRDWERAQASPSAGARTRRSQKGEWPWRENGLGQAEMKNAYRRWVLQNHPDQGGSIDEFICGKDDYEQLARTGS
jgi:hypothetical protein